MTPRGGPMLAIDTATAVAVLALGSADGILRASAAWIAGYRHGEELLARIAALLGEAGLRPQDLGALVVGTGPGAFTGLRVGLATAKTLAHEVGAPIVGLSTAVALLDAAAASGVTGPSALLLPAGPNDRVLVAPPAGPRLLGGGADPELGPGTTLIALDLDGRATAEALVAGTIARAGLPGALVRLGAARLAAGDVDDVRLLVPEYVSLPRGVRTADGEVAWSHGPR